MDNSYRQTAPWLFKTDEPAKPELNALKEHQKWSRKSLPGEKQNQTKPDDIQRIRIIYMKRRDKLRDAMKRDKKSR